MKTNHPLILTAQIADSDLEPFDVLRKRHFPPDRNFLRAHLTMFHRLPGEYISQIKQDLAEAGEGTGPIAAEVSGVRHLGAGVAFAIAGEELHDVRAQLKERFAGWLSPQDMQKWQPHITVQNKVHRRIADSLYQELLATAQPRAVRIEGLNLWSYLGGPWRFEHSATFHAVPPLSGGTNGTN